MAYDDAGDSWAMEKFSDNTNRIAPYSLLYYIITLAVDYFRRTQLSWWIARPQTNDSKLPVNQTEL
jgi:hypothetical protein